MLIFTAVGFGNPTERGVLFFRPFRPLLTPPNLGGELVSLTNHNNFKLFSSPPKLGGVRGGLRSMQVAWLVQEQVGRKRNRLKFFNLLAKVLEKSINFAAEE